VNRTLREINVEANFIDVTGLLLLAACLGENRALEVAFSCESAAVVLLRVFRDALLPVYWMRSAKYISSSGLLVASEQHN